MKIWGKTMEEENLVVQVKKLKKEELVIMHGLLAHGTMYAQVGHAKKNNCRKILLRIPFEKDLLQDPIFDFSIFDIF